jgi:hypothetical protein
MSEKLILDNIALYFDTLDNSSILNWMKENNITESFFKDKCVILKAMKSKKEYLTISMSLLLGFKIKSIDFKIYQILD